MGFVRLSAAGLLLLATGCAYPGSDDLERQGQRAIFTATGEHKKVARCMTDVLDHEKWAIGEMSAPVTRSIENPEGTATELQGGSVAAATILVWSAEIRQIGPDQVQVSVVGRRDVNPFLSATYIVDKLRDAVKRCDRL